MNTCPECSKDFEYDPKYHRCPGEWEAMCADAGAAPLADPYADMDWATECLTKVREPRTIAEWALAVEMAARPVVDARRFETTGRPVQGGMF